MPPELAVVGAWFAVVAWSSLVGAALTQNCAFEWEPLTSDADFEYYFPDRRDRCELLLRANAGRISKTQLEQHNIGCPRLLAEDRQRRQFRSTVPMDVAKATAQVRCWYWYDYSRAYYGHAALSLLFSL